MTRNVLIVQLGFSDTKMQVHECAIVLFLWFIADCSGALEGRKTDRGCF